MAAPPTRFRSIFDHAPGTPKDLAAHLNNHLDNKDGRLLADLKRWSESGYVEVKRERTGRTFRVVSAKVTKDGRALLS